jgi:hypothetical protein
VYQKQVVFAVMIHVLRNSLAGRETDLSAQVDNIICEQAVGTVVKHQML